MSQNISQSLDKEMIGTKDELPLIESQSNERQTELCGYLLKLSGRHALRGMKRRWFVFNHNNCKLYYYRTRDDLLPLGDIDIRRATFHIQNQSNNQSVNNNCIFTIVSFDKEFTLEANSSDECLFWLKQLQTRRRNYIKGLASKFGITLAQNHLYSDSFGNNNKCFLKSD
jgi:hypothetical protein